MIRKKIFNSLHKNNIFFKKKRIAVHSNVFRKDNLNTKICNQSQIQNKTFSAKPFNSFVNQKRRFSDSFGVRPHMSVMKPSATLQINEDSKRLEAQGKKIYKFGLGQSPFPVPDSVVKALTENAAEKDYLNVYGETTLRETVAEYYNKKYNFNLKGDSIMIGPGSKELMFLMQWVYNGNTVLPSPSWVSYAPQAQIATKKIEWIPGNRKNNWLLDPNQLDEWCTKKSKESNENSQLLFLNYPSNPLGKTLNSEELSSIAHIAKKHNLVILSDEIYGEVNHTGTHQTIFSYYPERTIISSGLSKWCGAGGWRLGTFVFPNELKWLRNSMGVMASETFSAVSAPIQYASITAFKQEMDVLEYLKNERDILRSLAKVLIEKLEKTRIRFPKPDGGFYFWLDFSEYRDSLMKRGIMNSTQFCKELLKETGVAVLPGKEFGREDESEFSIRLSYVNFDGSKALKYVEENPISTNEVLSEDVVKKLAPVTLEGMDLLIDFIER